MIEVKTDERLSRHGLLDPSELNLLVPKPSGLKRRNGVIGVDWKHRASDTEVDGAELESDKALDSGCIGSET